MSYRVDRENLSDGAENNTAVASAGSKNEINNDCYWISFYYVDVSK